MITAPTASPAAPANAAYPTAEQQLERIERELSDELERLARTGYAVGLIEQAESIVSRLRRQKD